MGGGDYYLVLAAPTPTQLAKKVSQQLRTCEWKCVGGVAIAIDAQHTVLRAYHIICTQALVRVKWAAPKTPAAGIPEHPSEEKFLADAESCVAKEEAACA